MSCSSKGKKSNILLILAASGGLGLTLSFETMLLICVYVYFNFNSCFVNKNIICLNILYLQTNILYTSKPLHACSNVATACLQQGNHKKGDQTVPI